MRERRRTYSGSGKLSTTVTEHLSLSVAVSASVAISLSPPLPSLSHLAEHDPVQLRLQQRHPVHSSARASSLIRLQVTACALAPPPPPAHSLARPPKLRGK